MRVHVRVCYSVDMDKPPKNPEIPFYFKDLDKRPICPACGKDVRVVVPSAKLTYLVHAVDQLCVIDNAANID